MPRINKPADATREIVKERQLCAKTFELPGGRRKTIARRWPVHFIDDAGKFQDIETAIAEESGSGEWVASQLPFLFRLHRQGIGFDYRSRAGGSVRVSLAEVGGQPLAEAPAPVVNGNRVTFADVAPGLDIVFIVRSLGVKTLRILKSGAAARSLVWEVTGDKDKVSQQLVGQDARGRKLELSLSIDGDRWTEIWSGKVRARDATTRVPFWSDDVAYPVTIDPTVNEFIAVTQDDGTERMSGASHYDSNSALLSLGQGPYYGYHPFLRFTTVSVPAGSSITSATLRMRVTGKGASGYGAGVIWGYDTDDAIAWGAAYGAGYLYPSVITTKKTAASVSLPRPVSTGIKSFDVTTIVAEITGRAGWASGNDLSLFVLEDEASSDFRTVFEDFAAAGTDEPELEIVYAVEAMQGTDLSSAFGSGGATATGNASGSDSASVSLQGGASGLLPLIGTEFATATAFLAGDLAVNLLGTAVGIPLTSGIAVRTADMFGQAFAASVYSATTFLTGDMPAATLAMASASGIAQPIIEAVGTAKPIAFGSGSMLGWANLPAEIRVVATARGAIEGLIPGSGESRGSVTAVGAGNFAGNLAGTGLATVVESANLDGRAQIGGSNLAFASASGSGGGAGGLVGSAISTALFVGPAYAWGSLAGSALASPLATGPATAAGETAATSLPSATSSGSIIGTTVIAGVGLGYAIPVADVSASGSMATTAVGIAPAAVLIVGSGELAGQALGVSIESTAVLARAELQGETKPLAACWVALGVATGGIYRFEAFDAFAPGFVQGGAFVPGFVAAQGSP